MSRPLTRTHRIVRDDMIAMKQLFGTTRNAYERLGLEHTAVKPEVFTRIMGWLPAAPDHVAIVENRWMAWKTTHLNSDTLLQPEHTFTLTS